MNIRKAIPQDAPGLFACAVAAFSDYILLIERTPASMMEDYYEGILSHYCLVAEDERGLLGFALLKEDKHVPERMWIEDLACDPRYKGKGVGAALIEASETWMRHLGKTDSRLYTHVKYTRAHELYFRMGYAIYERVQEYGYDRYYMKKTLCEQGKGGESL